MKSFEFKGSGFGYLWLLIWTTVASTITFGLFFPWAYSAQQRWICANTYCEGRQLKFVGSGMGFFFQWIIILVLSTITFGIYIPWGYTQFKRWETSNTVFASGKNSEPEEPVKAAPSKDVPEEASVVEEPEETEVPEETNEDNNSAQ